MPSPTELSAERDGSLGTGERTSHAKGWLDDPSPPSISTVLAMGLVGLASVLFAVDRAVFYFWHRIQLDLFVYTMGARHLFDGRLYRVSLSYNPHLQFTYPPFAALLFLPVAALSTTGGQVLWAVLNLFCLYGVIAISLRALRPSLHLARVLLAAAVLLGPAFALEPVGYTFVQGQVNVLLLVMVLADVTLEPSLGGRRLPRGILVGMAAAVKLVPLVFVPFFLVTRQRRAALWAAATFGLCTAVAWCASPSASWTYWTKDVLDAKRIGGVTYTSNQSLRAALDRVSHHLWSQPTVALFEVVVLVAGLALASWADRSSSRFLAIVCCGVTGLLVSPISWSHHFVWVVPVLLWLAIGTDRPALGPMVAAAGWVLFWWSPIWRFRYRPESLEMTEHGVHLVQGNAYTMASVAFLGGVAAMLAWRQRRVV